MKIYSLIVGNVGIVCTTTDLPTVKKHFEEYKQQSQTNYGRAAGESVTIMDNNDNVIEEFIGSIESDEAKLLEIESRDGI